MCGKLGHTLFGTQSVSQNVSQKSVSQFVSEKSVSENQNLVNFQDLLNPQNFIINDQNKKINQTAIIKNKSNWTHGKGKRR